MKAVIIDLTNEHEIKLLNTRITSGVSILSGYYLGLSEGDDPIAAAAAKLKQERLIDTPAYIIPPRGFVQAHMFHFPPMPDKEINKVLPREIAGVTDSSDTVVYSYIKNGIVMDRQVEKLEVAAFYSSRKSTFDFLDRLKSEGINAVKIIPETQGLKTLVETHPALAPERSGVVFLDLMASRINLNIFKSQYWSLERDFAFQFEPSDDLHDEDLSRISIELNRTFQYFKQRNRTYDVDRVILYGVNSNINHLKDFIGDNHPVTAEVINPGHFKVKISYPAHLKDRDEFLLIFTTAISVSVSMTRKKVLDLFPREFTEREKLPRRLVGLGISAAVIGAILIGSTIWLEKVKGSYTQDIEGTRKTYNSLSKNARAIDTTKRQRADYFRKRFFADFPFRYSYGTSDFIRRVSLIAAEGIQLVELQILPLSGGQDFSFALNGSIAAEDNIDAQAKFLRFYQELKAFEDMAQITFSTIKINAGEMGSTASRELVSGGKSPESQQEQVTLFFKINGQIELE